MEIKSISLSSYPLYNSPFYPSPVNAEHAYNITERNQKFNFQVQTFSTPLNSLSILPGYAIVDLWAYLSLERLRFLQRLMNLSRLVYLQIQADKHFAIAMVIIGCESHYYENAPNPQRLTSLSIIWCNSCCARLRRLTSVLSMTIMTAFFVKCEI